jgi:hypothetical protein
MTQLKSPMLTHHRVPSFWFFVYKLFSSWIWLKYCLLDLKQSINSLTLLYPALLMCRHCLRWNKWIQKKRNTKKRKRQKEERTSVPRHLSWNIYAKKQCRHINRAGYNNVSELIDCLRSSKQDKWRGTLVRSSFCLFLFFVFLFFCIHLFHLSFQ